MAILISEAKLYKMLDEFADEAYGVLEGMSSLTVTGLIVKFIEECKKSP
jgi:hypothetical protein